jgi:hypothetical protein
MNKNTMLLLLVAAGAFVMMNRAKATTASTPGGVKQATPAPSKNVNDAMWRQLLGGGWQMLRDAQTSSGGQAFLERNWLGQITTSDGKPIGQELADLLPSTYMTEQPVNLGDPSSGIDYLTDLGW